MRDPGTQRGDFTMIHPTGYHTSIGWYSAPVLRDNKVMGRIYIFHDVTDDRTAISLRANFVSRMSHELRTPLTSIKGFAQYMLEELNESLTPPVRDYVEIILDNAQLLNTLFSDIIEITRADIGDLKLLIGAAKLPDLVEHVVLGFEDQGTKERKWIETQIGDDLPAVQMDTGHISRVLSLLLSNAFQHAPVDSAIRILAQEIGSSGQLPFGAPSDVILPCILVTVEDQGEGIAADDTELIFQPFYRTRDARAARLEGSGLGLALARSILTLHRGKIWAEARRRGRRGAHIFFTLPISAE
jgi:signal transduction histidine kinase